MKLFLTILALMASSTAMAANNVALSSTVFVEKAVLEEDGKARIILSEPKVVLSGDKLVFILNYKNIGNTPATNFVVTNPLPGAVSYQGTPDARALVSIDGGKAWGRLSQLRVREADGSIRFARPEDVTHVRWALTEKVPVGAQGKLSFRGVVR